MKSKYKFGLHSFSLVYIFGAYIIFLLLFITSYHEPSCTNLSSLLSYSSWGQKSYMVLSHWTEFPSGRSWQEASCSSFPGFKGYPGKGDGTPLQYSCLENPMDGGAWWAAVHGVTRSQTRVSDFPFTFHFHALEKEMATHSSVLAWKIPGTGEPGGLPSMGSHRVGHDWSDLAAAAAVWFWGFPDSSVGKESTWNAGDSSSIPG